MERILYIPKKDQTDKKRGHEIWFNERITQDSISTLRNIIEKINIKTPSEDITLKINSPGGLVWEVIYLAEYFRNIKNPIYTIAEARCMSGAALLVAAGDDRSGWKNCRFMIHGIQLKFTFSGPLSKLKELTDSYDRLNTKFLSLLAEFTNQPLERILADTKADKEMNAQEALEYGLIDRIIPRIKQRDVKFDNYPLISP